MKYSLVDSGPITGTGEAEVLLGGRVWRYRWKIGDWTPRSCCGIVSVDLLIERSGQDRDVSSITCDVKLEGWRSDRGWRENLETYVWFRGFCLAG